MKSNSWQFIIMRPMGKVLTLRLKRAGIILCAGAILLSLGVWAFFPYAFFSLLWERSHLVEEIGRLKNQVVQAEQKWKRSVQKETNGHLLGIEALQVSRSDKGDGFSVSFRLVNQDPAGATVTGTLVMVAKDETQPNPAYRSIPEMGLEKGVPRQPEKGRGFEVQAQKFVEAYFDGSSTEIYKKISVYVYSAEGKLFLEKSAPIPAK